MADKSLTVAEVLVLLTETPRKIEALTVDLTPEQLRNPPEPGEWSAVEVLAHLRSCADVWGNCIATLLAEDRPTIKAINPTTWVNRTDYPTLAFTPSFKAYLAQRAELLMVLGKLPPTAWKRTATITGAGKALERDVFFYARWLANHERTHLKQLTNLAKTVRA